MSTEQNKMGIDIIAWRVRIGCFSGYGNSSNSERKCTRFVRSCYNIPTSAMRVCVKMSILLMILIVMAGDVELNPGPLYGTRQTKLTFSDKSDKSEHESEIEKIKKVVEQLSDKVSRLDEFLH